MSTITELKKKGLCIDKCTSFKISCKDDDAPFKYNYEFNLQPKERRKLMTNREYYLINHSDEFNSAIKSLIDDCEYLFCDFVRKYVFNNENDCVFYNKVCSSCTLCGMNFIKWLDQEYGARSSCDFDCEAKNEKVWHNLAQNPGDLPTPIEKPSSNFSSEWKIIETNRRMVIAFYRKLNFQYSPNPNSDNHCWWFTCDRNGRYKIIEENVLRWREI